MKRTGGEGTHLVERKGAAVASDPERKVGVGQCSTNVLEQETEKAGRWTNLPQSKERGSETKRKPCF